MNFLKLFERIFEQALFFLSRPFPCRHIGIVGRRPPIGRQVLHPAQPLIELKGFFKGTRRFLPFTRLLKGQPQPVQHFSLELYHPVRKFKGISGPSQH